jgi:hypothetical protein
MKSAVPSPKPALIVETKIVLSILKNVRNLQRSKKSHSDTENNYLI